MGRRQTFLLLLVLCVFASFVSAQTVSVTFLDEWGEATARVLEQSRVLLRVIDPAADTTSGRDSVSVDLSAVNGPDTATVALEETAGGTSVFEGEAFLTTDYALDNIYGVDADQLYTTWIYPGPTMDTATATYGGASDSVEVGLSLTRLVDGDGRGTETVTRGEPVRVRVRDAYADLSAGPDLTTATLTTSGGGSQVVTLTETGARTRVFEGSVSIQAAVGETVTVIHAESATGTTTSSDTATVAGAAVSFVRPRDGRTTGFALADSAIVARVVDVSRNLDPDAVETLGASISLLTSGDSEAMALRETGPDTGVFEGKMHHATNFIYLIPGDGLLVSSNTSAPFQPDTVRVQYEGFPSFADAQAPLVAAVVRLVDEGGANAASVALGSELRVELETAVNTSASAGVHLVEVRSLATGDVETLRVWETDHRSDLFLGALPVVPGAAAPGDGRLQAQPGETVEVEHDADGTLASDQETVARSAVRFVDEAGLPRTVLLEESAARVRVLDPLSAGQAPPAATIRSRITRDVEPLSLAELPGSPGLFEGSIPMRLWDWSSGILGTGREHPATSEPDTITAGDGYTAASLFMVPAVLEVVDDQGEPRTSASAGDVLRIRATAPRVDVNTYPEYLGVHVSSREFGHSQWVFLNETGGSTGIFEGTLAAARPGASAPDPFVYVEPADTIEVVYNASDYPDDPTGRVSTVVAIVPVAVALLDDEGEATESYLFGDDVHVRVAEAGANADPSAAETLTATVTARRYGDEKIDVETVILAETGPDTGVFTGTLPTGALPNFSDSPVAGNGLIEFPKFVSEPDGSSMLTVERGGVSALARVRDSRLWLVDEQGREAAVFPAGSTVQVWLRRPASNVSSGVDSVVARVLIARSAADSEDLTLAETGADTGLFTASILVEQGAPASGNGVLTGQIGDAFHAEGLTEIFPRPFDLGFLGGSHEPPVNQPPQAADDYIQTSEETPVNHVVLGNDTDPDGDPLTLTAVTQGANGSVAVEPDGSVTYTPNAGFNGSDTFTYTVSAEGGTDTATVYVTVFGANDPPDAVDDTATTAEEAPVVIAVKANDSDPDGDPLAVTAVGAQVANGFVDINADGTLTYTPSFNFFGETTFTYTISDGAATDTASVTVTVTPADDPPVAGDDGATTNEDTAVVIAVKANDYDPDGDAITVTAVAQALNGSVALNADQTVTYTPNPDFNGVDSFTYTLSDSGGSTVTGTALLNVNAFNDPPTAVNDAATTNEDTALNFDIVSNDTDPDGDPLRVIAVTQGAKGSVAINNSPSLNGKYVIYTPSLHANGSDSFTYTVSDNRGGTSTGTVAMTITPVNDVPKAFADSVTTAEDTPLTFDPRINDTDPDGDALTITSVSTPNRGSALVNAGGTVTYTPGANLSGTDGFVYSISDGNGGTWSALVTVTVTPVNDVPDARNDLVSTNEDTPLTVQVLSNDVDIDGNTLTVTSLTQPANGTAVLNADQTITYTPNLNFTGSNSFTYSISDGNGGTDTATVSVSVLPINDPPVAVADSATVAEEGTVTIAVAANDTDPENSALTLTAVTQGAHGTVTILTGNQVRYQPAANYFGPDSFTYTVRDPGNLTSTGTVNMTVNPVNDPPLAGPDNPATDEDTPVTVSVLANDTDVDGGALSVSAVTQGSNGTVTTNGTTVTYTPAAEFSGSDSFTYNVSDGFGGTATGLVTVTVAAVNDGPVANPDSASTREGMAVVIPVLANDTDPDGGTLTVTAVSAPGVLLADGTVRYTPGANFTGTATFSYTVSDGQGGTATGQVTVAVGEALERVAILATNSVAIRGGADVLSGDVIVNQATAGPYLNGAELSIAGLATTAANWDVEADSLTVAAGAVVASDVSYNQLTNNGTIGGQQRTPLALPVFSTLPAFQAATPGSTTINVASNVTRTLAPGSYLDLVVGRKGTVTFTGGVYHFRSITVDREAKLLFQAASEVRVQQKLSTKNLTTVGPAAAASIDASSIVFHVAGINGTTGALSATPKALEIGTNNTVAANLYAPNGTIWLQDGTTATGAFLGKDVDLGANAQVTLDSAFSGGQ